MTSRFIGFIHGPFKKSSLFRRSEFIVHWMGYVCYNPLSPSSKSKHLRFNSESSLKKKNQNFIFSQISLWLKQECQKGNCNWVLTFPLGWLLRAAMMHPENKTGECWAHARGTGGKNWAVFQKNSPSHVPSRAPSYQLGRMRSTPDRGLRVQAQTGK